MIQQLKSLVPSSEFNSSSYSLFEVQHVLLSKAGLMGGWAIPRLSETMQKGQGLRAPTCDL